jgi:hypothetical protein
MRVVSPMKFIMLVGHLLMIFSLAGWTGEGMPMIESDNGSEPNINATLVCHDWMDNSAIPPRRSYSICYRKA